MRILTNHLGYAPNAQKRAVICIDKASECRFDSFDVIDQVTSQSVFSGPIVHQGGVDKWKNWDFWGMDFSELHTQGTYAIEVTCTSDCGTHQSHPFSICHGLIEETISDVLYYFKAQRCADIWDEQDKRCPVYNENRTVDVHGGWYDASGDVSKYLSHLSYANFMNPQQTPLVVWELFKAARDLSDKNKTDNYATQKMVERLRLEACYGADFLVRMQDPSGAFYMTVFDQWTADPSQRMICEYKGQDGQRLAGWQAAYRQGGGLAIAALAAAYREGLTRDYDTDTYLKKAITGFEHLEIHNKDYCNDHKENIIDDYCALMAATELFAATGQERFQLAAEKRADSLIDRITENEQYSGWLRADDESKSFSHGADAGLPVIALLNYADHAPMPDEKQRVVEAAKKIMAFELHITHAVTNPFGYPRQYVTEINGSKRASFFIAQKNESGYWWQGENARIGSLATAARYTARHCEPPMKDALENYATACIDWLLGLNPYDACMLQGRGYNNAQYEEGSPNAPGGMCNGITAGFVDAHDIDFAPTEPPEAAGGDHRWRWGEQWIPHSGWYILAVSSENRN